MQPKYPQEALMPEFVDHLTIPAGYVELARIVDDLNYKRTLYFFRYERKYLAIVSARTTVPIEDHRYTIGQFEAPLEMLVWFSKTLGEFIKPSSQGGLHPGAMTSGDEDVGGEMLCIQRAMDAGNNQSGYTIVNRSRPNRLYRTAYRPSRITFPENFLYQGGLLNLIKTLGEKYQRGEL